MTFQPILVNIQIIEARDLPKMNMIGSVDPFFLIKIGNESKQTSVKKKNKNPTYNESFSFHIKSPKLRTIEIICFDWDRFSANKFIASIVIPFEEFENKESFQDWFSLGEGKEKGEVLVSIARASPDSVPQTVEAPAWPPPAKSSQPVQLLPPPALQGLQSQSPSSMPPPPDRPPPPLPPRYPPPPPPGPPPPGPPPSGPPPSGPPPSGPPPSGPPPSGPPPSGPPPSGPPPGVPLLSSSSSSPSSNSSSSSSSSSSSHPSPSLLPPPPPPPPGSSSSSSSSSSSPSSSVSSESSGPSSAVVDPTTASAIAARFAGNIGVEAFGAVLVDCPSSPHPESTDQPTDFTQPQPPSSSFSSTVKSLASTVTSFFRGLGPRRASPPPGATAGAAVAEAVAALAPPPVQQSRSQSVDSEPKIHSYILASHPLVVFAQHPYTPPQPTPGESLIDVDNKPLEKGFIDVPLLEDYPYLLERTDYPWTDWSTVVPLLYANLDEEEAYHAGKDGPQNHLVYLAEPRSGFHYGRGFAPTSYFEEPCIATARAELMNGTDVFSKTMGILTEPPPSGT